jgi:glutathione peroxidase
VDRNLKIANKYNVVNILTVMILKHGEKQDAITSFLSKKVIEKYKNIYKRSDNNMIYDYKVKDIEGNEISMEDYRGKVLLIVNTATGCGFTPQYEGLQKLYDKYKDSGFEILDFPSNQFFEQAPGDNAEISQFCKINYGTAFKTFGKIDVNGENADGLYKFLKKEAPKAEEDEASEGLYDKLSKMGFNTKGDDIKWNFTKFLIDRKGNVDARFAPTYEPEKLDEAIKDLLENEQ